MLKQHSVLVDTNHIPLGYAYFSVHVLRVYPLPFLLWKWINMLNYLIVMQGRPRTSTRSSCCLLLGTCFVWKPMWHSWILLSFNGTTLIVWFCYEQTSGYLLSLPPCFLRCCALGLPSPVPGISADGFCADWLGALLSSETTPWAGLSEASAAVVAEQPAEELHFLSKHVLRPGKQRGILLGGTATFSSVQRWEGDAFHCLVLLFLCLHNLHDTDTFLEKISSREVGAVRLLSVYVQVKLWQNSPVSSQEMFAILFSSGFLSEFLFLFLLLALEPPSESTPSSAAGL